MSYAGMIVRPGNGAEQTLVREAPTIPELYSRTVASDPGSTYDQSSFVPQVSQTFSQAASTGYEPLTAEAQTTEPAQHPSWLSGSAPSLRHMASCTAIRCRSTVYRFVFILEVIPCLLQP